MSYYRYVRPLLLSTLPLFIKVFANCTHGLLLELTVRKTGTLRDLGLRLLTGHFHCDQILSVVYLASISRKEHTVNKNSGLLATVHCMWHICATIAVGITNSKDTRLTSAHPASNIDLIADHTKVHLCWKCRGLNSWEVDNQCISLDRLAGSEVKAELVKLLMIHLVPILTTILEALDGSDCTVVNGSVPSGKLLLPVCNLCGCPGLAICGLRPVDKGNDISVQSVGFQHVAQHIGDIADHSKWLVSVLVAIAPRTPEDTLAPCLLKAWSRW